VPDKHKDLDGQGNLVQSSKSIVDVNLGVLGRKELHPDKASTPPLDTLLSRIRGGNSNFEVTERYWQELYARHR
jgi:hypothetical protein